tara:strand:- start:6103 stop:6594 length:492 start_codon:yes stop_codon:yes gene_type:complete
MLFWPRLWIIIKWSPVVLAVLLVSCASVPTGASLPIPLTGNVGAESMKDLSILSAVGGICIIGGVLCMVLPGTSNLKGGTAILIGIVLILLNIGVKEYLPYIYVPFLVGTGLISMAVTYKTIRYVLNFKRKKPCSLQPSLERSGSRSSSQSAAQPSGSGHDPT